MGAIGTADGTVTIMIRACSRPCRIATREFEAAQPVRTDKASGQPPSIESHQARIATEEGTQRSSANSVSSESLGIHSAAFTLLMTCSGFVAPGVTEGTVG
jgi:hypothetical protein